MGCHSSLKLINIQPASQHGQLPGLYGFDQGTLYLSWIEQTVDSISTFQYSTFSNGKWTEPILIAKGTKNWFLNWSEAPKLTRFKSDPGTLAAYWLEITTQNPYDHDVKISTSTDAGLNWNAPFTPHPVKMKAYYGQCAFLPLNNGRIFMVWLDGRNTKMKIPHTNRYMPSTDGEIMLAAAEFDKDGKIYNEQILDDQISALSTPDVGLLDDDKVVVYRNRTDDHVKDIYITREIGGQWTSPRPVWKESWVSRTHPVSGPQLAIQGEKVAVVWYTEANHTPRIHLSISDNGGESFSEPIQIDNGNPTGMPDVTASSKGSWIISWLEMKNTVSAELMIAEVEGKSSIAEKKRIAEVNVQPKSSYPQLATTGKNVMLTWSNQENGVSVVHTYLLKF